MTDEQLFLQLMAQAIRYYGVKFSFAYTPPIDPALTEALALRQRSAETDALEAIAAALREDTSDFACVDQIIGILEKLGYTTVPRHDFG